MPSSLPSWPRTTSPGSPNEAWVFRHDKVWDYFIAKAFSGDIGRQNQYMADSRFRGTYLMLIQEEPLAAARDLEKRLSDYAAKTKDHSVNDDVRKLLMDREQHENAQSKIDDNREKEKDVV